MMLDAARGIQYLHSKRIIHRDIKVSSRCEPHLNSTSASDFADLCFFLLSCNMPAVAQLLGR